MVYLPILKEHYFDERFPKLFWKFFALESISNKNSCFCITSGEQRDLKNNKVVEPTKNILKILTYIKNNPKCIEQTEIGKYIAEYFVNSKDDIKSVLKSINSQLKEINDKNNYNRNFLGNDFFSFFSTGGIIYNDYLESFNIGDANIILLNEYLDKLYSTKSDTEEKVLKRKNDIVYICQERNDSEKCRSNYKSIFRNTSSSDSYGSLTGEKSALEHVNYYNFSLTNVKYIVAFTKGYKEILENKKNLEDLIIKEKKIKPLTEGTIICYKRQ